MKHEIWCPLEDMKKERLWYAIVVRDRHGKVVSRERRKSHSFLKQWNQLVYVQMAQTPQTIMDIGGTPRVIASHNYNLWAIASAGQTVCGICVGTGNTPVAIDDFQLETQIAEGVGGGQMEHLICTVGLSVVAAPSCYFVVPRTIANNSGGIITVREAAIYVKAGLWPAPGYTSCVVRDVLVAPQAVPNGGAITIDWTIGVTV